MITLSKEKVLYLHSLIADETGGDSGLRDTALLESALASAFATFDGIELYPTIEEKAARIGASLIGNHAFVDGNKRIGMLVFLTFLEINGVTLAIDNADIIAVGLATAAGKMKYPELLNWIKEHKAP